MKVAGIIAEYNPFHCGHRYQIEELRRRTDCDYIIIAMSGDFVQRGEPAILDKYTRTQMALSEGADLVLELPVPFATASAERFARGGVSLLAATGIVDLLCFGAEVPEDSALLQDSYASSQECFSQRNGDAHNHLALLQDSYASSQEYFSQRNGDAHNHLALLQDSYASSQECFSQRNGDAHGHLALLQKIAALLNDEPPVFKEILCRELASGASYPSARSAAITAVLGDSDKPADFTAVPGDLDRHAALTAARIHPAWLASILTSPNNILAMEYLRSLQDYPRIQPVLIPRKGDGYHAAPSGEALASATGIRSLLLSGDLDGAFRYIPKQALAVLREACGTLPLISPENVPDKNIPRGAMENCGTQTLFSPDNVPDRKIPGIVMENCGTRTLFSPDNVPDRNVPRGAMENCGTQTLFSPDNVPDKNIPRGAMENCGTQTLFSPECVPNKKIPGGVMENCGTVPHLYPEDISTGNIPHRCMGNNGALPFLSAEDLSAVLGYRLLSLSQEASFSCSASPYSDFADCSPALASRIASSLPLYQSYSQFCDLLKTRELTHARIRRSLLHILLGIRDEDARSVSYLRILGFRRSARPLLSAIKKRAQLPLVTKMADARRTLPADAFTLLQKEVYASDLYMQLVRGKTGMDSRNEYNRGIVLF